MAASFFDDLGGEPVLRRIVDRFVDRVFDDVMIGFFFRSARRERIKQKEYEHAAQHLGAPIEYTGRPLDEAHRAHPIMGGQFARRLMILKETLEEAGVPEHVKRHWLEHTEALRPLITGDASGECDPTRAQQRVESVPNAPLPHRKQP
ncbi:MAG TPA: group 1 truncated hemoglobin [Polyangiaceae bacterium]|nr:group 1 truncated hemoglobin [Polyangiaceae bacterium]